MIELTIGHKRAKAHRTAYFNPMNIIKIAEANEGHTFLDCVAGGKWSAWTIYEPFQQVLNKVNEGLNFNHN